MESNNRPNIIFLSIDALRPRNLGCYGYKRNTSPNIDSYSKQGILFKNNFSSHNSSNKSFLSILGGRHILGQDFEHYPTQKEMKYFFDTGGVLLPQILKKEGYKTYFLKKLFGWQKIGFDYYYEKDVQEKSKKWNFIRFIKKIPFIYKIAKYSLNNFYFIPKRLESKIRFNNEGEMITDGAIKIIKENKENNFFLWLHYPNTHVPYIFPYYLKDKFLPEKESPKIFEILSEKEKKGYNKKDIEFLKGCWKANDTIEEIIARYDTSIFYVDSLIEKIINTLRDKNLLQNTIIFIFADHGESLNEHELYFTHEGLYDVTFNVPLIMLGGQIPKNRKIGALTQLEDIAPTVLELIGANHDPLSFDGKSLLPLIKEEKKDIREELFIEEHVVGIGRRAIRTKKYKYIETPDKNHSICKLCNSSHGPLTALYDLEKNPEETINLAEKNRILLKNMKTRMDNKIKNIKTLNEKRKIKKFINKVKSV